MLLGSLTESERGKPVSKTSNEYITHTITDKDRKVIYTITVRVSRDTASYSLEVWDKQHKKIHHSGNLGAHTA